MPANIPSSLFHRSPAVDAQACRGIFAAALCLALTGIPTALVHAESPSASAPVSPPGNSPDSLTASPSRFIGEKEIKGYVETMAKALLISKRSTDPFGQVQDPDAKPIIKPTVAKNTRRAPVIQATPFSEIVRLIKVNTIMPSEKQFLIGTRTVKQGETLPLNFRGRSIKVVVTGVSSNKIDFRNLDSGETASISLSLLPAGMSQGTQGLTPPGMVPHTPNAPIDLDPGDAFNSHP